MSKRIFAVVIAAVAMISVLAGCSGGQLSASQVVEKSQEKAADNYRMEATLDLKLSVAAGEGEDGAVSVDIPISLFYEAETDGELSHGEVTAEVSMVGQSQKTTSEFYTDGKDHFSTDDGSCWVRRDVNNIDFLGRISPESFSDAEVSYDKEAGTYTVNSSLGNLLKDKNFRKAVEKSLDEVEDLDIDEAIDNLEGGEVIMKFDSKTFNLFHCEIIDVRFAIEVEDAGVLVQAEVSLDAEIDFSDFGEIDEDDVSVPKTVKRDAEEEGTSSRNFIDGTVTAEIPQSDPADEILQQESDMAVPQISGDDTGAYNGVAFKTGVGDWNTTFGADGWEFETDSEGDFSFVIAHNAKYKGAELYLYGKDYVTDVAKESSIADVKTNGFYGYNIDASYSEGKPPMTWRGLTFGASGEDILAVYGAPRYSFTGELYTTYEYSITDDVEIVFYAYADGGLQSVNCYVWG